MEHKLTDSVITETIKLAKNDVRLARVLLLQAAAKMTVSCARSSTIKGGPLDCLNTLDEFITALRNAHAARP